MQIKHLAPIWLESGLFRHAALILHLVFSQEHLSWTVQYLLEDLQKTEQPFRQSQHPELNCQGWECRGKGLLKSDDMILWFCL